MHPVQPQFHNERQRRLSEAPGTSNAVGWRGQGDDQAFSVIIPTVNEEDTLPGTLGHLGAFRNVAEIVVVDGHSEDRSVAVARHHGARVLQAERGRGTQLNVGARAARCDNLMFLHADCRLPHDAFGAIRDTFASGRVAGVFAIDFGSRHPILATLSRLSHWPSRWTQFGEGALFLRRDTFEHIGGFPDWPLLEDVEILRRLRRHTTLARANGVVRASPRRFVENGVTRQMLRNLMVYTLFQLGMSPHRLVRLYRDR